MVDYLPDRLPEDVDAERSLLATICGPGADADAREIVAMLSSEDFVHPAHRAVFEAVCIAVNPNTLVEINALTLKDLLSQTGKLGSVGDFPGLVELLSAEEVGRPIVLAEILLRKSQLRKLIRLGAQLARQSANEEGTPEGLLERLGADLALLTRKEHNKSLRWVQEVADDAMPRILDRLEGVGETGLKVHFPRLDALTNGFQPGNLIVLAARPGIGKSALALNWMYRSASHGMHGSLFSLEMSEAEVYERLIQIHGRIDLKTAYGQADPKIAAKVLMARDELIKMPMFINDTAHLTVRDIRASVDRHITTIGQHLDYIIIDYLQLLSSPEGSRGLKQSEAVRVAEISRGLKMVAKDYNLPVFVLSQLNREVEHRQSGRPQLSDLRDSGAIEQDADVVLFIHRKMAPVAIGEDPDPTAELLISKHRSGPTGIINLFFEGQFASFREIERDTYAEAR